MSEADPSVRDSSAEALGALLKALGEKIFLPNLGDIEQIKLDKVNLLLRFFGKMFKKQKFDEMK